LRPSALVICATPRSGTTLLCDLLTDTGVTGRPDSFYRAQSIAEFADYFGVADGPDFERRYLAAILAEGCGSTDLFSIRVMWPSLSEIATTLAVLFPDALTDADRIAAAFGTPLYVHVSRQDKLAQAISRSKAEQSGLWHRNADGSERERVRPATEPVYDAARINDFIAETAAHETSWRNWFAAQGITSIELTYEELSADPQAEVARLVTALGRDPAVTSGIQPRTARLADAESTEWAARFRAEP
jgi:trehalose 2-sulfotransferase